MDFLNAEQDFFNQLITNASLWVDTFFLLSGFLVAHSCLYQIKPKDSRIWHHLIQHPKAIVHRYFRLTPSVIGILGISILFEIFGSGPLWNNYVELSRNSCHKNWWNLFLYVNNFCNLNSPNNPQNEVSLVLFQLDI